jgi:RNA-directed DNA polymerase
VILTRKQAQPALQAAHRILESIGLTLNTAKTRTCQVWHESFTFLGYTFGVQYSWGGRRYLGKAPADKGVAKYRETICKLTASDQTSKAPQTVAANLNRVTRGYWNYFSLGTTVFLRHDLDAYLRERMMIWAKRKYKRPRKRTGQKRAPGQVVRRRVDAALALLVYGRDVPRVHHSREALARGASAACPTQ